MYYKKAIVKIGKIEKIVVITTAQLHWTKPELRFCAGSNPARGVSKICNGEDLTPLPQIWLLFQCYKKNHMYYKKAIVKIEKIEKIVVITTAQLHWTKPELRFYAGSNLAHNLSEICDGEDLWQWSLLEIRLNNFHRSTVSPKQFIIIIKVKKLNLFSQRY